ncbi:hypothetical protein EDD85DRAFT_785303 [Armillaria nabsnona]|nr:hypothetical protein EDD85DRAFT_785303 [Armillaria nabsnona]
MIYQYTCLTIESKQRYQMEGSDAEGFDNTTLRKFMNTDWSQADEDVGGLLIDDKYLAKQKCFIQNEINKSKHHFYYFAKGSAYANFDVQGTVPICVNPVCGDGWPTECRKYPMIVFSHAIVTGWAPLFLHVGEGYHEAWKCVPLIDCAIVETQYFHWNCTGHDLKQHLARMHLWRDQTIHDHNWLKITDKFGAAGEAKYTGISSAIVNEVPQWIRDMSPEV